MNRFLSAMSGVVLASLAAVAFASERSSPREGSETGFRYLVFETAGAGSGATLPMIVGLHYSSAKPETMLEYFDAIDFPVRIVLPQGEYPRRDGYSWFPTNYAELAQAEQDAAVFATEKKLAVFVDDARKRFPTRGKPIAMGISYGGDVSFLLALRHPDSIAASFPVAARFLPAWMPISNTCEPACPPIRALHGEADKTVPMGPTRDAIAQLRKKGYDATMTPYSGVEHDFDVRMERDFAEQAKRMLDASR